MSMSLFGSLLGDMDEDPIFSSHFRTMRRMNSMMNSMFSDPFSMMGNDYENHPFAHRAGSHHCVPSTRFAMPNLNRLLSGSLDSLGNGHSYSSSTVVSMTSGPDGRPQVYKASSSTRCAPGGVKETQRTVSDSMTGTKKMAIGHHIGERAHIVEREQNVHSGDQEERQDFINLDEEEAEDFNKEWETKTRSRPDVSRISGSRNRHSYGGSWYSHSGVPAITSGPSNRRHRKFANSTMLPARKSSRDPQLTLLPPTSTSSAISKSPYSPPGQPAPRRSKNIKTVSGSPPPSNAN